MSKWLLLSSLLALPASRRPGQSGAVVVEGRSVSEPVVSQSHLPDNKFTKRTPLDIENDFFGVDSSSGVHQSRCPLHLEISWHISIPGGVYASPVIGRFEDGRSRQILIPSYKKGNLHMVDSDGHYVSGWPFTSEEKFQTSPVLTDIDRNGAPDIIWTSTNGKIFFISGDTANGASLLGKSVQIPGLDVPYSWFEGLDSKDVDASLSLHEESEGRAGSGGGGGGGGGGGRETTAEKDMTAGGTEADEEALEEHMVFNKRKLLASRDSETTSSYSPFDGLTDEARESMQVLSTWLSHSDDSKYNKAAASSAAARSKGEELEEGEEEHIQRVTLKYGRNGGSSSVPTHIAINPHVLANPVLVDLDFDGYDDVLMVAVSYYFDQWYFKSHPDLTADLPKDLDLRNYVAAGVISISLETREILWQKHLDLTTAKTDLKAMIYATPTVCDLDMDGSMDVVVATRLGFVYRLDARTGEVHRNFPIILGDIQAQVAAVDLVKDNRLELLVADANGNIASFDCEGNEIWSRTVSGFATQTPSIGDINQDGKSDIVFGLANSPFIWALDGETGDTLENFPIKIGAHVIAPVTIADLSDSLLPNSRKPVEKSENALHIIFPAFDGFLYVINGKTGCTFKIDLGGEEAYSMVLVDDILGHGKVDLLVSTFQGSVFCISSAHRYSPLAAITTQYMRHGPFERHSGVVGYGIEFDKATAALEMVTGREISVSYNVHPPSLATPHVEEGGRSRVFVYLDGKVVKGSVGDCVDCEHGTGRGDNSFSAEKGNHLIRIPAPNLPGQHRIQVKIIDWYGWQQEDSIAVDVNTRAYRLVKWAMCVPFIVASTAAILFGDTRAQKDARHLQMLTTTAGRR